MTFYAPFCIPFIVGATAMFVLLLWKWGSWFAHLAPADRMRFVRGVPTRRTLGAVGEVVCESLLHRRIFRVNPLLGYMHMSLAFGWFLLIAAGWIETMAYLGLRYVPLQGHVFFRYFATNLDHKPFFDFLMDLLLLFVLSGVALAWFKRLRSRALGLRRTTRHVPGDRIASRRCGASSRRAWPPRASPAPSTEGADSSPAASGAGSRSMRLRSG